MAVRDKKARRLVDINFPPIRLLDIGYNDRPPTVYLLRPEIQNGNPGQRGTIMNRERILEVVLTKLGVALLIITASGAWAQQSAPPASDQTPTTALVSGAPKAAQCSAPAFDQQSVALFEQQAPNGDAAAQCGLGMMHYVGQGMPQDYTQAALWFRKAAERGNAEAQYFLGLLYHDGQGVPQNYIQAAVWWRKAAEQGDAGAQYSLGYLYCHGQGVPQDYTQAAGWYQKAAEQGNADAQFGLGSLYGGGFGVPQDYTQAVAWFRKASEQGNAEAQYLLGLTYLFNRGVPLDYAEAYFWLDLAAAGKPSDVEQAAKFRDQAASHLTPTDLSRAQERARKWFEAHQAKPQ
jgi:TPR repeat protein